MNLSGVLALILLAGVSLGASAAPLTPEEGADTPVWLALLPDDGPTGGFFENRQPKPW